ncbi:MAG: MFS transporter [Dehalococcoidia bacterium]|nr:MFS transporter [Dehalococcoidia bacterium]
MKRPEIFHGWWVVAAAAIVSFWGGVGFYCITAFIKPVVDQFGWSYLEVSIAGSLRSVEIGLIAPFVGFLADRFGPKRVALVGGIIGGLGYITLSLTNTLLVFYLGFFIYSIGLTGMGHGVTVTAVANWFRKKVGMAMGFTMVGYGLGGVFLPIIVWMIGAYDWRATLAILGLATWVIVLPSAMFLRHRPEELGLSPDGEKAPPGEVVTGTEVKSATADGLTVMHAVKTRAFWVLSIVLLVHMGVTSAITLHAMPFFISINLPPETGAVIGMLIPVTSIIGRLIFGWLGDRFGHRRVLFAATVLQSAGLIFLAFGTRWWHFVLFLAFYGPAFGGTFVLRPALQREYFGRAAFGSIQGVILAVTQIGGLAFPMLAGWTFDINQSYQLIWLAFAATVVITGPLLLLTGKPSPGQGLS